MQVDGIAWRQCAPVVGADQAARGARMVPAQAPEHARQRNVPLSQQAVRPARRQQPVQQTRDRISRAQAQHIAWCALQQRDMRGLVGQRGHQAHRGRTAAYHQHAPPAPVELRGPVLGVDYRSLEPLQARQFGGVAEVMAIVAGRAEDPAAGELLACAGVGALYIHGPQRRGAGPGGRCHPVLQPHLAVHAVLGRGFAQIGQDLRGTGHCRGTAPGLEGVAQGMQVGVRTRAGVAEQVPGAARGGARFKNGVRAPGMALLQIVRRRQPREAGADDQYVQMLHGCARDCLQREDKAHGGDKFPR